MSVGKLPGEAQVMLDSLLAELPDGAIVMDVFSESRTTGHPAVRIVAVPGETPLWYDWIDGRWTLWSL